MDNKIFELRTYGFCELAQLYFPHVTKKSASRMLSLWIQASKELQNKLTEASWKKRSKYLTPKQVKVLVGHLDAPF